MANRLGLFWKKAFASMCVLETNHCLSISGVWVWKYTLLLHGKEEWLDDGASYNWTKLHHGDDNTKALMFEYFSSGREIRGKTLSERMIFQ